MKKNLFLLALLTLPAFSWLIQPGYFPMHDDLQSMRQYQMDKCFRDLQIPCRWVPDMGFGFGYPLFNYYPPLPYYLGQIFRIAGFSYIDIVKIVGVLGFVVCALNMYLLGREFFGRRGGFIASAFYTYAPYHSVDYYVRGAVNEFYAMAFYPAIFLTLHLLIKTGEKKYIKWSALSIAGLMLSHNLMLLIFTPIALAWSVFWLIRFKKITTILPVKNLFITGLWSLGLSAFFTLPVIFEAKYAHIETLTMGYFNFLAHFLNLRQIFIDINWGYGASQLGPDGFSLALGYLHWLVPSVIIFLSFKLIKLKSRRSLLLLLLLFTLTSLFLTHSRSTPLWNLIPLLQSLQFPWRFLTISVFSASFLSGALALIFNKKIYFSLIIILLLILNANYFRPNEWFPGMIDSLKFSGMSWQRLITSGIFDYLPKYAKAPPADPAGSDLNIVAGSGKYQNLVKTSDFQLYQIDIGSQEAVAELQTFYFPGWTAYLDGNEIDIDPNKDSLLGRIQVKVPEGNHRLEVRFKNTPVRELSNLISVISWLIILVVIITPWIKGLTKSWIWRTSNHVR